MSKLAELLNPAPSSASETSSMANHAPQVQPLVLDGRNHRTSFSYSGSPTHTRHLSITSPGLEALADAASNTAPIPSPKQNVGAFTHSTPFQPSYSHFGSRPSSSHTTLPPLSNDYSQTHPHHNIAHSSSLEQYHHHSSIERRLSNVADAAARLPPLQGSPTDQPSTFSQDAPAPLNGITDYANGLLAERNIDATAFPQQDNVGKEQDHSTDTPVASQVRQSSSQSPQPLSHIGVPDSQGEHIEVKAEIAEISSEMPRLEVAERSVSMESPAVKNAMDVKKDTLSPMAVGDSASAPSAKPKAPPSKKRAAPKKGTASSVKPAAKKRKLDNDSVDGTPSVQRSGTPATSRASNTPAPKFRKQNSVTPARSSSVVNGAEDEDGSEEDTEAYCICRKPDDHTLMVACDGPCEDWFHARCVSMDSAKAKLIYKWYCPNCAETGLETLWRRMCRLEGCQEPARQDGETKSKYCCDEHGAEFMKLRVFDGHADNKAGDRPNNSKRRRRDNFTDNYGNTGDPTNADPGHLHGGVLKASELKAVTDSVNDVDALRRLGDGVLSPPPTASPEGDDVKIESRADIKNQAIYTPEETAKLEEIAVKRDTVRAQKKLLDERDRFLLLVTARAKTVLGELREQDKSVNTICGYDTRISWSDDEFNAWRISSEGKSALEMGGVLGAPATGKEKVEKQEDGENVAPDAWDAEEEIGRGVCKKKRCERHKAWLKLMQQEILFETHQARQAMKKLEAEEKGLKDRAMIRHLEGQET